MLRSALHIYAMFRRSVVSMQTLGGRDDELQSNEHLPGIDSTGPYPAVNPADALPPGPTRYTSTMGNEGPPHVPVAIVSVILSVFVSPLLTVALPKGLGQHLGNQSQRQLDADHPTPGIAQYIPIDPQAGPPPLEQFPPAIPVRLISQPPLPSSCIYLYGLSHFDL